jgi:hypothetical protein
MEEDSNIVRDGALSIDRQIQSSMPDRWVGHGRIAIRESDTIDAANAENKAIEILSKKMDEDGATDSESMARKIINAVAAKKSG